MKMSIEVAARCLVAMIAWTTLSTTATAADTLRLAGTISGTTILADLAKVFETRHPNVKVELHEGTGSSAGIRGVTAGRFDISVAARGLRDESKAAGLREFPFAKTPLVFFARTGNAPVFDMTEARLMDVLHGRLTTWPDGRPLRIVLHDDDDSLTVALARTYTGFKAGYDVARGRRGVTVATSDQEVMDAVERAEHAMGYGTLAGILGDNRRLRALTLNGVTPSATTAADGTYSPTLTLRLIVGPTPSPSVDAFMALARSTEGRHIIEAKGAQPLSTAP